MAVSGFAELTLEARDLDGLAHFYTEAFGLEVLQRRDDRIWLSAGRDARLGLWTPGEKEFGDEGGRHVHFAFAANPGTLDGPRGGRPGGHESTRGLRPRGVPSSRHRHLPEEGPVAWQTNVLVVANRTAGSDELIAALKQRAGKGPLRCFLLMPTGHGDRAEARERLHEAVDRMRTSGIDVTGRLGVDANPLFAVAEVWDHTAYDEIVVSTLPTGASHWLNLDLPQRIAKLTNAPVDHVVTQMEHARAAV